MNFTNDLKARMKKSKYMRKWQKENPNYNAWAQYNKIGRIYGEPDVSFEDFIEMQKNAPRDLRGRALMRPRGPRKKS